MSLLEESINNIAIIKRVGKHLVLAVCFLASFLIFPMASFGYEGSSFPISADGRYILFSTFSTPPGCVNTGIHTHLVRKDMQTGNIVCADESSVGEPENGYRIGASTISASGHYAMFATRATNLTTDCDDGDLHVFRKDLQGGDVICISTNLVGNSGNGFSAGAVFSKDERYAAFYSTSTNLTTDCDDGDLHVFRKNLVDGEIICVSTSSSGILGNSSSLEPSISDNGRYIVFRSGSTNLVPDCASDKSSSAAIFRKDVQTGDIICVSTNTMGDIGDTYSYFPFISDNGNYVVFSNNDNRLIPGCGNLIFSSVLRKDLDTGQLVCVSTSSAGDFANSTSYNSPVSADGRYVSFYSGATNLISGCKNEVSSGQIYRKDLQTGAIVCVGTNFSGDFANNIVYDNMPSMSADGRYVVFSSKATNLVSSCGNGDNFQIFRKDLDTGKVRCVGSGAPVNDELPMISGDPRPGSVLTCSHGSWTANPTGFEYQWKLEGNPITGATSDTYSVPKLFLGHVITCTVRASNDDGSSSATSEGATIVKLRDEDGDGLPDIWETDGYRDDAGNMKVNLPAMGADPDHKDVFVQFDSMEGLRYSDAAMDLVVKAFDDSPVNTNLDGKTGIHLHIDNGPGSVMNPVTGEKWGSRSDAHQNIPFTKVLGNGDYNWANPGGDTGTFFDDIKSIDGYRARMFHYVISVNRFGSDDTSAIGRARSENNDPNGPHQGSDFLVALGHECEPEGNCPQPQGPGGVVAQAGSFMHEFGHNLGLQHGGQVPDLYVPNYVSVMNYSFATVGIHTAPDVVDYSRYNFAQIPTLDENHLDETIGFNVDSSLPVANELTQINCSAGPFDPDYTDIVAMAGPVDFDCNGNKNNTDVSSDLNKHDGKTLLRSYEDWHHLIFDGGAIGGLLDYSQPAVTTPPSEPTAAEVKEAAYSRVPPPTGETREASNLTDSSVTLNGVANSNGEATQVAFQYGKTTSYGSQTAFVGVGSDYADVDTNATVSGLEPGETYHYQEIILSPQYLIYGNNNAFTTPTSSPPPPELPLPPPTDNPELPSPTLSLPTLPIIGPTTRCFVKSKYVTRNKAGKQKFSLVGSLSADAQKIMFIVKTKPHVKKTRVAYSFARVALETRKHPPFRYALQISSVAKDGSFAALVKRKTSWGKQTTRLVVNIKTTNCA